ncbi:MAG: efflux RND transporter permease subunit [Gammaproteobacteria bacterium]|nr:efflux RND transporter permease subunit [Gammaproteobacteria bacterium]
MDPKLGIAGRIAQRFAGSEITLLLGLTALLLGVFAVVVTPREEEPQINVTFANVFIAYPGAGVREIESLISTPAEQVLSEIEGVEHIYSQSLPGRAVLTVQFKVGEDRTRAIVRLYNALYSNQDWLPANLGVSQPLIKPKGIDDVPIVTLTLWSKDPARGAYELQQVAHALETDLKRVNGTRNIYTVGGPNQVVRVRIDPVRLAGFNIALDDLRSALRSANVAQLSGAQVRDDQEIQVEAGQFLTDAAEIGALIVGLHNHTPVYLRDVAKIAHGPAQPEQYVRFGNRTDAREAPPAVTLAIAKQAGTNAVVIAGEVIERIEQLKGTVVPEGVEVSVTRNYGATANDKALQLITKLIFATLAVVLLVLAALGWREAVIVGVAVVITLALTLFASWAWGFTLNRVSLFALIFSIGILVDDAIVVVENIHRHRLLHGVSLREAIPHAVDEVGGPTILATFTVIAALLPMAFVSGLMGPYMSPIPINASIGMLISLAVAFIITPWLSLKLMRGPHAHGAERDTRLAARLHGFFRRVLGPFLEAASGRSRRRLLWLALAVLILLSLALVAGKLVVLKMLPFDNKSEFQVVVDMPEGVSVERTARVLDELGAYLSTVPEVRDYQTYAGTAAPINFNGLVRQYYLRHAANAGDIQVNLVEKSQRQRKSHDIARAVRAPLQEIGKRFGANVKIAEVPPGPPVLAPLVAEVYGPDYAGQTQVAEALTQLFARTPDVVDVDNSVEAPAPKLLVRVDQQKAALLGVTPQTVVTALATVLGGEDVSYLHAAQAKYAVPIRLEFSPGDKAQLATLLALRVRAQSGALVPLSGFTHVTASRREQSVYHKDLRPVVYVAGDMAGPLDSPLYGMFDISAALRTEPALAGVALAQSFIHAPQDVYSYGVKWDGEWRITYETFRDMGIAYAVGMVLIYLLVVAQFRSYLTPLIIMAPIPLTLIGILPGHALLGAQFTATSMIGMIALAGIMVRNSILLVDFINQQLRAGVALGEAVISAGAVRTQPILLTGLAAMLGALFILDDPIFNGLAISLLFGVLVSTLLTLLVIPLLYYAFMRRRTP